MSKCRVNIAVIEPSQIIYEGFSNMLLKSTEHYCLYRLSELAELTNSLTLKFSIVILNPAIIQNKISSFLKIKKNFPDTVWIGLVYSFYDSELLMRLDDAISITDSAEQIIQRINNLHSKYNCEANHNKDLTDREVEVLIHLTRGLSSKEIADKLNISVHTVVSHRKNLVEKTGIKSLPGLTLYAISKNFIKLEDHLT